MQDLLERPSPPSVIVLELYPQLLELHGFPGGAVGLLESLWRLGYTDISHSGYALSQKVPLHLCCLRGQCWPVQGSCPVWLLLGLVLSER